MTQFIKGNYDIPNKKGKVEASGKDEQTEQSPQQEFERRALAKLGGSIAFIAKPSLVWNGDDDGEPGDTAS